jgi:hypothetical protein
MFFFTSNLARRTKNHLFRTSLTKCHEIFTEIQVNKELFNKEMVIGSHTSELPSIKKLQIHVYDVLSWYTWSIVARQDVSSNAISDCGMVQHVKSTWQFPWRVATRRAMLVCTRVIANGMLMGRCVGLETWEAVCMYSESCALYIVLKHFKIKTHWPVPWRRWRNRLRINAEF